MIEVFAELEPAPSSSTTRTAVTSRAADDRGQCLVHELAPGRGAVWGKRTWSSASSVRAA